MAKLVLPKERDYGWELKPTSSSYFSIYTRDNGQMCIVLAHSLIRGCTTDMIYWWFRHFAKLKVKLIDIEGYEGVEVPAYFLWHPSDHIGVQMSGELDAEGCAQAGSYIHIQEAFQAKKYGLKYAVDSKIKVFYCEKDGWGMGKDLPFLGRMMCLRNHFKDVYEDGKIIGVHYFYEVIIGLSSNNAIARFMNKRIKQKFSEEMFSAWHLHNAIEVGTFENFLPALYAQREQPDQLIYQKSMNPKLSSPSLQKGYDQTLYEKRVEGYKSSKDPFAYQATMEKTFL